MEGLRRHFITDCFDWYSVLAFNIYCVLVLSDKFKHFLSYLHLPIEPAIGNSGTSLINTERQTNEHNQVYR